MLMRGKEPQTETGRLEALSDGVFAVAITLLALELKVPPVTDLRAGHSLADALLEQWPIYLAYVLSFSTVLITWVNHHALFRVIRRADHGFLLLNGLLLMSITSIPFVTELLAAYLRQPDRRTAMVVYSGVFLLMAVTFNRMWAYAAGGGRLLGEEADREIVESITRQFAFGPLLYAVAFLLAFWSAAASLALSILLAVFYAFPSSITRVRPSPVGIARLLVLLHPL